MLAVLLVGAGSARADEGPASAPSSRPQAKRDNKLCLECHLDGVDAKLRVQPKDFARPPHSEENGVSCVGCHVKAASVKDPSDHGPLGRPTCDGCHDAKKTIAASAHGRARHPGSKLPSCASCHGAAHKIAGVAEPTSPMSQRRQLATCGRCHSGPALENYRRSVHGRRLERGQAGGPTCSSCHNGHGTLAADIERNPRFKVRATQACGGCHAKEMKQYAESIHGRALLENSIYNSASCIDCHKSHEILPPSDPASAVHPTKVVSDCAGCHADARLIKREHLPSDVVRTYELSYHGRAGDLGAAKIAVCSSCHENHAIFPSSDPRSSVHPNNVSRACGKCHPGAGKNFVAGKIHVLSEKKQNYWAWVVRSAYIWLIVLCIGGMVLHNLLDFARKQVLRARRQRHEPHIVRMTGQERVMHAVLLTSFLTLVYTGFAILYPRAWWAAPLSWISDTERFRSGLHRTAGAVLTLVMLQHLWFLFLTARGREQRRELRPGVHDLRDLWHNLMFYLGRSQERPRFGRFSYMEKAEYWALVWGTAVMVVSGFVMWFENQALQVMPRWLWEVFQTVHRFEAILATLAILVWHFYFVFVNPDEAPMALTWLTGKMPLEDLALQHPEEFARVVTERGADGVPQPVVSEVMEKREAGAGGAASETSGRPDA
jgi:cytochrome b subunit of formate dehydrogenase/nitrate/TMAO reductase-like tetraheme cytochrome c subunit